MNSKMTCLLGLFCSCFVVLAALYGSVEAMKEFKVGDDMGWQQPPTNNTAIYSQWAANNRFQVGDTLCFTYQNDSVLVVDKWDYYHCNTSDPLTTFNNGKTVIKLDRPGSFYFISGAPGHCKNGQRLLVDVLGLHQSPPSTAFPPESDFAPAPAPAPSSAVLVSVALSLVFVALLFSIVGLVWCAP